MSENEEHFTYEEIQKTKMIIGAFIESIEKNDAILLIQKGGLLAPGKELFLKVIDELLTETKKKYGVKEVGKHE